MKWIERDFYLDKLKRVQGTPDIKVITGIRRSGKSRLVEAFADYVQKTDQRANVTYIDLTSLRFEKLLDYHGLNDYVEERYEHDKANYLFVDEVQLCSNFELAINSLHASGKYDIYVTGSNAFLLSSDLATLFTGRTFEIEVFSFSLREFMNYNDLQDPYKAFERYVIEGGMAGSYVYATTEEKYKYIADVFDTLIVRDIRQKYRIRNAALMDRVADFLMDNISNLSSARSIADSLTSNRDEVNHKTVSAYMSYLCNAFAFYQVRRFDIKGKKYLASNEKYFLGDHAFRYAKLGTRNLDYGRMIENIVAIDLLRRGYELYAGVLYKKEIDFVAIKRDEKIYIQVSDNISDPKTFAREVAPLLQIKDAYPKMIIARTKHDAYQYEGIQIIDVANWLNG